MKKVIVFLLTVAIALGGLVFAHAAVTASQDDLLIYPNLEEGSSAVLEGLTTELTFTCGSHLRWHTAHTFGGQTSAEFVYDPKGTSDPTYYTRNHLSMGLSNGVSVSMDGGGYPILNVGYGGMIRAVVQDTPTGGSTTKQLRMADYLDYYRPNYDLFYEDAQRYCSENFDLSSWMLGGGSYEYAGAYLALNSVFRFPVQEGNTMTVTTEKDDAGRLCGIELYPENGPELYLVSDVNAKGIWFVPMFQDETGNPLPYESPAGHGIYFIPWAHANTVHYTTGTVEVLTPDVEQTRLLLPLDETRTIIHMEIDADAGEAWMLTCDAERYVLTALDLTGGQVLASLEVLPRDPGTDPGGYFLLDENYLLAVIGDRIALADTAARTLLLTAPDSADQAFGAHRYNNDTGDISFDGETLVLAGTIPSSDREGAFWTAAYRQDQLVYYGEYGCSLMPPNDSHYYSAVSAEHHPILLK